MVSVFGEPPLLVTAILMRASISRTKSMEKASSHGPQVTSILASIRVISDMAEVR